jgi:hypothetical protein
LQRETEPSPCVQAARPNGGMTHLANWTLGKQSGARGQRPRRSPVPTSHLRTRAVGGGGGAPRRKVGGRRSAHARGAAAALCLAAGRSPLPLSDPSAWLIGRQAAVHSCRGPRPSGNGESETAGPGRQQATAAAARRLVGCARRPERGAPAPLWSALHEMFGWVRHCRYCWQLAEFNCARQRLSLPLRAA